MNSDESFATGPLDHDAPAAAPVDASGETATDQAAARISAQAIVEVLVDRGYFDDVSLVTLLGEARHQLTLAELERSLARDGRVSDSVLSSVKAQVSGYGALPSVGVRPVPVLPGRLARSVGAVVVNEEPLTVAMVEDLPDSLSALREALGAEFLIQACTLSQFVELFRAAYERGELVDRPDLGSIYDVLDAAVRKRASDLHISVGIPPILRVDGRLEQLPTQNVDAVWLRSEIARLVGLEKLALIDTNHNLDQALPYGSARFRVNYGRERNGYTVAARKIPSKIPQPEDIGLPPAVRDLVHLDRGLVLVTGPTGSGKSTTLASLLAQIARTQSKHIITLEDPIEFILPPGRSVVHQRELGASFSSFSEGLRQALRQDPDVILVGEMRDRETIKTALTAAETGHLVFGTLHTYDASSTLTRIVSVFPPEEQDQVRSMLGYILKAVVSQTLLPNYGGGRSAAFEVMIVNAAIANNLRRIDGQAQLRQIIETSQRDGMQTMDMALAELVRRRSVSLEAALEKAFSRDDLQKRLDG